MTEREKECVTKLVDALELITKAMEDLFRHLEEYKRGTYAERYGIFAR